MCKFVGMNRFGSQGTDIPRQAWATLVAASLDYLSPERLGLRPTYCQQMRAVEGSALGGP
jgi:hypothetical protein